MRRNKDRQSQEELLDSKLKPGERVLWKCRPVERNWTVDDTRKLLLGTILFSLCLAFFFMLPHFLHLCLHARPNFFQRLSCIGLMITVLTVVLLLAYSLHSLLSPWRKRKKRRNTLYVLTDQRIITLIREFFSTDPIPKRVRLHVHPHQDGTGDVILKYRKIRNLEMKDMKDPRQTADTLKKLMTFHSSPALQHGPRQVAKRIPSCTENASISSVFPEKILNRKLKTGERILWKNRPVKRFWTFSVVRKMLYGTALLLLPLALVFATWQTAIELTADILYTPTFYFFILGVLIASVVWAYPINAFASIWKERKLRRNTFYVLTQHRLITVIDQRIRTYPVHKIREVRQRLRRNGSGNIILKYGKKKIFRFKDIINAREAVDILKRLRSGDIPPERER